MKEKQPGPIKTFRAQWAVMTFYERFEQVIALALSAIIAVIIVVSLLQLISIVFSLLVIDAFNPLDHKVFQTVFGMIMTLLIAMEFKHSIVRVALRRDSIIQVKTVILIGLIALARKFVILDPETSPAKIAALAGATLGCMAHALCTRMKRPIFGLCCANWRRGPGCLPCRYRTTCPAGSSTPSPPVRSITRPSR